MKKKQRLRFIVGMVVFIIIIGGGIILSMIKKTEKKDRRVLDFPVALLEQFEKKNKALGKTYKPRTRHLNSDGSAKYTNRLFLETSPYLLQHAHNPVNWYPWGDEAFQTAKKLNRPVLLSVGYSTCHWCHVMEEESFEDTVIANYMNIHYVTIKVDREERPDIDAVYMSAVRALTGQGGWPMTVWLTPDRKPFYGGTYFPPRDGDRGARTGFLTILNRLQEVYHTRPDDVARSSQELSQAVNQMLTPLSGASSPTESVLHEAARYYKQRFDSKEGGLSGAPKFPSSLANRFLLRYYHRTGDKESLNAVKLTLKKMARGGIYDHVGGGFHRYSTDAQWQAPHFEKMLYDNALLAITYLEAYQVTKDPDFKRVVTEILRYIERDMTSPEGVFYSATDADSLNPAGHREEGWFFTWTPDEINQALSKKAASLVKSYYHISAPGNFEGRTILTVQQPLTDKQTQTMLADSLDILYKERLKRPFPIRDEKIITAWNGLMISAYARSGFAFNHKPYVDTAARAAQFILDRMMKEEKLYRSYKDGMAKYDGYLDDYAFFIAALLDLYEATFNPYWLKKAIALDDTLETQFEDQKNGGFFMTSHTHEPLLAREKPGYDGAEPAGNSVSALNLMRLYEFTTNAFYRKRAEKLLTFFSTSLQDHPAALSEMLLAIDFQLDKAKEIILVTPINQLNEARPFLDEIRGQFIPNKILVVTEEGDALKTLEKTIPLVSSKYAMRSQVTAYVCENGSCKLPTTDKGIFTKQISK